MSGFVERRENRSMGWRQLRNAQSSRISVLQNWTKPLKILFLAVAIMMIVAIIWQLQTPVGFGVSKAPVASEQEQDRANLATKIHLEQFDGQRTLWTLGAPSAHRENEILVVVETPRLSIFRAGGEQINITAKRGTVDKDTRIMIFEGSVRAQGDHQFGLLTTEWLQFDPKKGILYTDQRFDLQNRGSQLQGVGLTLFHETKKVHVPMNVEMKFIGGVPALTGEWGT
jgi:LPS export ABC transporter protein LptC